MQNCLSQWRVFLLVAGIAASIFGIGLVTPAEAKPAYSGHRLHQAAHKAGPVAREHRKVRHRGGTTVKRNRHHKYASVARRRAAAAQFAGGYGETFERTVAKRRTGPARRWDMQTASRDLGGNGMMSGDFGGGNVVSEARRWLGTNPTQRARLWCATFMNFVLERTGRTGTGSNLARSFASHGQRVSGPQVGAIAVMARRGGGHVGVVSGIDSRGNPIIISGNHGRKVAEAVYPRGRVYAYVMP